MPRFNLLKEIKSTRNTVLPNTPVPGQGGSKVSVFWSGLALIAVVAAGFAGLTALGIVSVSYSPGRTPPIIIDFTGAGKMVDDTGVSQKIVVGAVKKERPAPVVDAGKPAPDENGGGDDTSNTVMTLISRPIRPIAEKAAGVREKPESTDVWYIRFALCVMKKSCERILAGLKKKGVNAYIVKSVANLRTHRVIAGPWATGAQAREATEKLKKRGYDSSIFTSGGRFFFSTEPLASQAVAEKQCGIIKEPGSGCRTSSKKEARSVYKIYEGALKNRRDAVKKRMAYTRRGIDCIVESD